MNRLRELNPFWASLLSLVFCGILSSCCSHISGEGSKCLEESTAEIVSVSNDDANDRMRLQSMVKLRKLLVFRDKKFIDISTNQEIKKQWCSVIESNSATPLTGKLVLGFSEEGNPDIVDPFSGVLSPSEGSLFFEFEVSFGDQRTYIYVPTDEGVAKKRFPDLFFPAKK